MAWRSSKQSEGNFSPIGTRSVLIFKYLDAWGEAYRANDKLQSISAVVVLETYLAPYLRNYWKWDVTKDKISKLEELHFLAEREAEEQLRQAYKIPADIPLTKIFENDARKDQYEELLGLSYGKWRATFLTRVIEDNQLLGGGKDAITMEGFDSGETEASDLPEFDSEGSE